MRKTIQIALVFIGTIVGAGLASGQEITQFFTNYGNISFIALFIPLIIYIFIGKSVINISTKHKLSSYSELCTLVAPGITGKILAMFTTLYLLSSCSIILAGAGSLLYQYLHLPKIIGTLIMIAISIIALLRKTKGLIEINSLIVPMLIIIISVLFISYISFSGDTKMISHNTYYYPNLWVLSAILYGGFNIMGCSGVIVPLSSEVNDKRTLTRGLIIGAIFLTIVSLGINYLLACNFDNISRYDIPLLYVADRFGKTVQITLLIVIFCEMFSTVVSDTFSMGKTLESSFNIPYKIGIVLILVTGFLVSLIGFKSLISALYPAFGVLSVIFMYKVSRFDHMRGGGNKLNIGGK